MPTIPIYRQQTEVSGVPNMGRIDPSAAAAPAAALERIGVQGMQWAEERRAEFDTLRAEEAFNKLRERQMALMLDPEKGFAARKSKDAARQGFTEEYLKHFQAAQNEIGGTLSRSQRELFQRRAAVADAEYRNALMRHVLNESNRYAAEVFEGTLQVETNRATTEWNNPYTVQSALERIDSAIAMRATSEGLAADTTDALLRNARSKVHSTVIGAALEAGNVGYADQYLKANAEQMSGLDLLKVRGMTNKALTTEAAVGIATEVVQRLKQQAEPGDFGRLVSLVKQRESGGRQDAVSPKGAVGVMQVMPTTGPEAAKLAGLPWNEERLRADAKYNEALGAAYLAKQLHTFGGDVIKALAAYNAGPGAVQKALKDAKNAGGALGAEGEDWLALLPKETQDYVQAILPKFTAGEGAGRVPTAEDLQNEIRQRVGAARPELLKAATDEGVRQLEQYTRARRQREDEAYADGIRWLEANSGDFNGMPPSLKSKISPEKYGSLREYASKVAKGEPVETDWDVYYTLRTDPKALQQANLMALKGRLNDTEFKELARQQEELRTAGIQSQLMTVHQRMNLRFTEIGLDPSRARPGSRNADKAAKAWSMLDQRVRAAEVTLGRKLKPEEMDNEVDKLFASVEVRGLLFGTVTRRGLFAVKPDDEVVVPDEDRKQITAALQKARQPVTEEAIQQLYRRARGLE